MVIRILNETNLRNSALFLLFFKENGMVSNLPDLLCLSLSRRAHHSGGDLPEPPESVPAPVRSVLAVELHPQGPLQSPARGPALGRGLGGAHHQRQGGVFGPTLHYTDSKTAAYFFYPF